jgi:hypothetical protein
MPYWLKRCLKNNFFAIAVFFDGKQYSLTLNHILSLSVLKPVVKNQGGHGEIFLSYSDLKFLSQHFP